MKLHIYDRAGWAPRLVPALFLLTVVVQLFEVGFENRPLGIQEAAAYSGNCVGDDDADGDVDGKNLYSHILGGSGVTLSSFAGSYGRVNCLERINNSAFTTFMSVLSKGQLTLNNKWTQGDLNAQAIDDPITWQGKGTLGPGEINSYTISVQQYRQRLKQCEEDSQEFDEEGDRKCYPKLVVHYPGNKEVEGCALTDFPHIRYGYYCGAGHGPGQWPFNEGTPEPLDAVDYCCRLHDAQAWSDAPFRAGENECGILMCLDQATGSPANIMSLLPRVEASRQCWYEWAASWCGGDQYNDARAPILGP